MAEVPIRRVLFVSLAVIVMLVVGAFFLVTFGEAQGDVDVGVSASEAGCQSLCSELVALGYNVRTCDELMTKPKAVDYLERCAGYGPCNVTIRGVVICIIQ
ncbi:hypothetical protein GF352_04805 [archaeon]|nr:hypothetical protein [archaeon]